MKSEGLKKQFQDEIREPCVQCKADTLVAYWDYELEYYIYLSDSAVCSSCASELVEACEVA